MDSEETMYTSLCDDCKSNADKLADDTGDSPEQAMEFLSEHRLLCGGNFCHGATAVQVEPEEVYDEVGVRA
jgi:hypothetical protein